MSVHTKKSDTHQERYVHVYIEGHPRVHGATVYVREYAPGMWGYAVALCHREDQFSRKVGRTAARRRYFQKEKSYFGREFSYQLACEKALLHANEIGA